MSSDGQRDSQERDGQERDGQERDSQERDSQKRDSQKRDSQRLSHQSADHQRDVRAKGGLRETNVSNLNVATGHPHTLKERTQSSQMNPELVVFSGAKGGTGRSVICALTALTLAERNSRVLLIDLSLSSSNLHTLLGAGAPPESLERWLMEDTEDLEELCYPIPDTQNLKLLSAASSIVHLTDISPSRIRELIRCIQSFEVDYILIDLGAAHSIHHIDILNAAHHSFCVTTPEPTSIEGVYTLYKSLLMRRVESSFREHPWLKKILKRVAQVPRAQQTKTLGETLGMIRELDLEVHRKVSASLQSLRCSLILNRALPDEEARVVTALSGICRSALALEMSHTLTLPEDEHLPRHIRTLKPLQSLTLDTPLRQELSLWVDNWFLQQPYSPQQDQLLESLGDAPLLTPLPKKEKGGSRPSLNFKTVGFGLNSTPASTATSDDPQMIMASELTALIANNAHSRLTQDVLAQEALSQDQSFYEPQAQAESLIKPAEVFSDEPPTHSPLLQPPQPHVQDQPSHDSHNIKDSFIEPSYIPEPLSAVLMDDPPRHEVTSLEEEVKTPNGWCHLKTSDLAPFRPAIQTSIYREGVREVFYEESYLGVYESEEGTQLEKRVERIHYESAQLLSSGGVPQWRETHNIALESKPHNFTLVTQADEGYFKPR